MAKEPVSVTLDRDNLLWLRGRMATAKRRSLSEMLDEILTAARLGGRITSAVRSVAGTVDIAADDPALDRADSHVRGEFEASLARPLVVHEERPVYGGRKKTRRG